MSIRDWKAALTRFTIELNLSRGYLMVVGDSSLSVGCGGCSGARRMRRVTRARPGTVPNNSLLRQRPESGVKYLVESDE
jgi:hypothetical protein